MTVIRQDDLIQSVADALQYISYYHPVDFIRAVKEAYEKEESKAAKDAMAQILVNSRMAAMGRRPICQDTGIVTVFAKVGMNVTVEGDMSLDDMINEGVRRAYNHPENVLRASVLADPDGKRANTKDNTPAVINYSIVPGDTLEIDVAAKGGGSEAKSKFAMLNPSDSVVDWVLEQIPKMGAGWCPPGMLGIGIAGTDESCHSELSNAVLNNREGLDPHAVLSITLPREILSDFALGHIIPEGLQGPDVMFEGDKTVLSSLADLLDIFPAWFPIATHDLKSGEPNL